MKRLLVVMFPLFLSPVFADPTDPEIPEDPVPTDETFHAQLVDYFQSIDERLADAELLNEHVATLANALDLLDGQVLAQDSWGTAIWDGQSSSVQVWQDNELQTLTSFTDAYGRPAFESAELQGWVDVLEESLYVHIVTGGATLIWIAEVVQLPPGPNQSMGDHQVVFMAKDQCTCKGSNNACDEDDCRDTQPCTYTNNGGSQNSSCKWLKVPDYM